VVHEIRQSGTFDKLSTQRSQVPDISLANLFNMECNRGIGSITPSDEETAVQTFVERIMTCS